MAEVLSNSGIVTGQPVLAAQVSQSVQAFTGVVGYDITISGSLNLPANTQMNGTASEAIFATSAGSTTGPTSTITISEEAAAETNFIVFSPSSSAGGSAQSLKNTDTVGGGGATGGLEYNAQLGNLKGKSFESSVTAATTIGFVGTSSFSNLSLTSQASTLTNEAGDTACFIPFYTAATGDLPTKTNAGLTFNSSTQLLTATSASFSDIVDGGNASRINLTSASFADLVVSGAGRTGGRFTVGGVLTSVGNAVMSSTLTVAGTLAANRIGTLDNASLKFPIVATPDTYTAIHFDGTTDDARIEYGHDATDEFFTRIRMSDNLTTDHFDVLFTSSGAGNNSTPFSAYGNKVLLAQPSDSAGTKVGIGVSPSGSMGVLLTVEASASAASRVMAVRKENAGANVFEVEIDATGDGFVGILSGSNQDDGIRLHSNAPSYFNGGKLGIGSTAPTAQLTVRTTASAASTVLEIENTTGQKRAYVDIDTNGSPSIALRNASSTEVIRLNAAANEANYIGVGTGTPNLGLGVSSPTADLHIQKTGSVTLKLESDEVDGSSFVRFLNDAIGWRLGVQSTDKFTLYDSTNDVVHLVAENNANRSLIGIGTSNPTGSVVLDVAGPMRLSGSMVQRFQSLSTSNNTYGTGTAAGCILSTVSETANVSSSLILLTDFNATSQATLDITGWTTDAQVGQLLEVCIVGDGSGTTVDNGIRIQFFNGTATCTLNGGQTATLGSQLRISDCVYSAPNKFIGADLKILKTGLNTLKVWGSSMTPV